MLSSTSPLLQVWYMRRKRSEPPYWLFAWSNAGSLLALLSFPLLLEPAFDTQVLAWAWSGLFVVFALLTIAVGYLSRGAEQAVEQAPTEQKQAAPAAPPSLGQMVIWVVLAAGASGLLVAVSANMSTNVAPIPLLWVVPLALYLLTFILAFSGRRFYHPTWFFPLVALAIGCMAVLVYPKPGELADPVCDSGVSGQLVHCLSGVSSRVGGARPAARFLTRCRTAPHQLAMTRQTNNEQADQIHRNHKLGSPARQALGIQNRHASNRQATSGLGDRSSK